MENQDWSNEFAKACSRSLRSRMADFLSDAPRKLSPEAWEYLSLFAQFILAATDENAKEISDVRNLVKESSRKLQEQLVSLLATNRVLLKELEQMRKAQVLLKEFEQMRETQALIAERYKHSQNLIFVLVCFVVLQIAIITYLSR